MADAARSDGEIRIKYMDSGKTQGMSLSKLESLIQNYRVVCVEMSDASERQTTIKERSKCPLNIWSEDALAHSRLSIEGDIRPSYKTLLQEANDKVF